MMKFEDVGVLARRDRWLIPLAVFGGVVGGFVLVGAGVALAYMLPARCSVPPAGLTMPR